MAENETVIQNQATERRFFRPEWKNIFVMVGMFLAFFGCLFLLGGWKFAAVFTVCLTIHEAGHLWAMKHRGMQLQGLYFLPGIGVAAVPLDGLGTREDEAFVAIMGPVWGAAAGIVAFVIFVFTGLPEFVSAAWLCVLLNLFNMIPAAPLDGGRVMRGVLHGFSPRASIVICLLLLIAAAVFVFQISWLFAALVMIFGWQEYRRFLVIVRLEEDYRLVANKTAEFGDAYQRMASDARTYLAGSSVTDEERQAAFERLAPSVELKTLLASVASVRRRYFSVLPWGFYHVTDDGVFDSPYTLVSYLDNFKVNPRMSLKQAFLYLVIFVVLSVLLVVLAAFCSAVLPFTAWMQPLLAVVGL